MALLLYFWHYYLKSVTFIVSAICHVFGWCLYHVGRNPTVPHGTDINWQTIVVQRRRRVVVAAIAVVVVVEGHGRFRIASASKEIYAGFLELTTLHATLTGPNSHSVRRGSKIL